MANPTGVLRGWDVPAEPGSPLPLRCACHKLLWDVGGTYEPALHATRLALSQLPGEAHAHLTTLARANGLAMTPAGYYVLHCRRCKALVLFHVQRDEDRHSLRIRGRSYLDEVCWSLPGQDPTTGPAAVTIAADGRLVAAESVPG